MVGFDSVEDLNELLGEKICTRLIFFACAFLTEEAYTDGALSMITLLSEGFASLPAQGMKKSAYLPGILLDQTDQAHHPDPRPLAHFEPEAPFLCQTSRKKRKRKKIHKSDTAGRAGTT